MTLRGVPHRAGSGLLWRLSAPCPLRTAEAVLLPPPAGALTTVWRCRPQAGMSTVWLPMAAPSTAATSVIRSYVRLPCEVLLARICVRFRVGSVTREDLDGTAITTYHAAPAIFGQASCQHCESAARGHLAVREFCRGQIADYKLPRGVAFVDALLISGTSKVLKRELRKQNWDTADRNVS